MNCDMNQLKLKIKIMLLVASLLPLLFFINGCFLFRAVGTGIGQGISAGKNAANDKKTAYLSYLSAAEKNNTEREIHNLPPVHVLTFKEWQDGEVSATNVPPKK